MVLAAVGHTAVHVDAVGTVVLVEAVAEVVVIDADGAEVGGDDAPLPHEMIDDSSTRQLREMLTHGTGIQQVKGN